MQTVLHIHYGHSMQTCGYSMLGIWWNYGIWSHSLHKKWQGTVRTDASNQYYRLVIHSDDNIYCIFVRLRFVAQVFSGKSTVFLFNYKLLITVEFCIRIKKTMDEKIHQLKDTLSACYPMILLSCVAIQKVSNVYCSCQYCFCLVGFFLFV